MEIDYDKLAAKVAAKMRHKTTVKIKKPRLASILPGAVDNESDAASSEADPEVGI
jgi:hypothetical protein